MQIPQIIETEHFRFVDYTLLSESEQHQIHEARNHPDITVWMENQDYIPWHSHLDFVSSLSNNANKAYYGVFRGGILVGSQSLNPINGNIEGESGQYLFPAYQGKGLGRLMKTEFFNYIFENNILQKITEKVKKGNYRNQHINEKLGFRMYDSDEKSLVSINRC